jgi:hypothetical protein
VIAQSHDPKDAEEAEHRYERKEPSDSVALSVDNDARHAVREFALCVSVPTAIPETHRELCDQKHASGDNCAHTACEHKAGWNAMAFPVYRT